MWSLLKKIFVFTALALTISQFVTVSSGVVLAGENFVEPVEFCTTEAADTAFCKDEQQNPPGGDPVNNPLSPILGPSSVLYKLIQIVTMLTGAISTIMIMVGGFRYIVSGGDSTAIKSAKDTILYAVIGLAVTIFAQTIITFVLSSL